MKKYIWCIVGILCTYLLCGCSGAGRIEEHWSIEESEESMESEYSFWVENSIEELERIEIPKKEGESLYTYSRMVEELRAMEEAYPELLEIISIGESALGRDIPAARLGRGEQELLFIGCIHGCEFSTVNYMMRCIREYVLAADTQELYGGYDMDSLLRRYTFYIVPMANPDGFEISNHEEEPGWYCEDLEWMRHDYSCNGNGMNLNRNFPFEWEGAAGSTEPAVSDSKGSYAGSEPETQALMKLCGEHEFLWMFSFHNYGHCVYWQDTVNGSIEGDEALADQLCSACGFYKTEATSSPTGYGGGFENWFRMEYGRPGFCVELGILDYDTSVFIEQFEDAVAWDVTRYAMLQGLE